MEKKFEPLFTPWKIGNVEIKNRIVLCPMGGTSLFGWMEPNHFDEEAAEFFLKRAQNNVGLIIPGIAPLRDTLGGRWLYQNKGMFKKLKVFMDEIHKTGAKLFVQLTAGMGRSFAITDSLMLLANNKFLGTLAKPIINVDYLTASPSELPSRWAEDYTCRALTVKEIKQMIEAFKKTALLCKEAGVDGVEIHAVHEGYLLDQFTLPYTNKRTDEYGGSFENRYRFPVEVVKAIKEACGKDYPVSLRYSVISKTKDFCKGALPEEKNYKEVGRDLEESKRAAKYLQDAGYDMLNADNGTYDAWYWAHPPGYMPENCNLSDVAEIKKVVDIPVVCAGRMNMEVGADAVRNNLIDGVGVARQFLTDPEWITKLLEDRMDEIKPCICCHNGCFTMAHHKGHANDQPFEDASHMARCALNPQTMHGHKYDLKKTTKPKNIAIVGAGIGGMESAIVLTLRGHKVKIYEKSDHLGGVFVPASVFSFKEKDRELLKWYEKQLQLLNIEVEFNKEIKDPTTLDADEVIIATGSKAKRLPIKGNEFALDAISFLNKEKEVKDKVAIIGGGLTGCELAYELSLLGKHPIIIETQDDLMKVKGLCLANTSFLRDYFALHEVPIYLEAKAKEIGENFIVLETKDNKEIKLDVDNVIVSIGYNSTPLCKDSKKYHVVGDAYKVGNLRTVIWRAWDVALKI